MRGGGGGRPCRRGDGETEKKKERKKKSKYLYVYQKVEGGFVYYHPGPAAAACSAGCEQPPPRSAPRFGRAAPAALGERAATMSRAAPRCIRPLLRVLSSFFLFSPLVFLFALLMLFEWSLRVLQ